MYVYMYVRMRVYERLCVCVNHKATDKRLLTAACISRALLYGVHAVQAGRQAI